MLCQFCSVHWTRSHRGLPGISNFPKLVEAALAQYGDRRRQRMANVVISPSTSPAVSSGRPEDRPRASMTSVAQTTDPSCLNRFLTASSGDPETSTIGGSSYARGIRKTTQTSRYSNQGVSRSYNTPVVDRTVLLYGIWSVGINPTYAGWYSGTTPR